MNIKQLEYFNCVYEKGSITLAAKELYLSQQGISNSIKELEDELGKPLFFRKNNKISPTIYADYLYSDAKKVVEDFFKIKSQFNKKFIDSPHNIKIALAPGMSKIISFPLISDFKQHTGINVELVALSDLQCEKEILDNNIDIAFTVNSTILKKTSKKILYKQPLCVVYNTSHRFSKYEKIDVLDLKNERFVMFDDAHHIYHNMQRLLKEHGFLPNIIFTSFDYVTLLEYIKYENVIMICPEIIIKQISEKNLNYRRLETDEKWEIIALYNTGKDLMKNDLIIKFIDFIRKSLS